MPPSRVSSGGGVVAERMTVDSLWYDREVSSTISWALLGKCGHTLCRS